MKKYIAGFIVCMGWLFALSGCSKSEIAPESGNNQQTQSEQRFTVVVESIGELFSQANSRRPISSVSPQQTFDKLTFIIIRNEVPAEVVYKKTFDGWSSTDNLVSTPWSEGDTRGRKAEVKLAGSECLENDKDYLIYAVGYQSGSYDNYVAFEGVNVGDSFYRTEIAEVLDGEAPEEVFAGAEFLHVRNGKIYSVASSDAEPQEAVVVLRRQVAGTFGYFTRIPVVCNGENVAAMRLVTTRKNRTVIFGGFRGVDDAENFRKENVINGMTPSTDYNAVLAGSASRNAFTVYNIKLANWFPGNIANAELPLDENGDGYLDAGDNNWQIDNERYPEGSIKLPAGTVFDDAFLVSVAMTEADIAVGLPTFQMQLLGANGKILKYWNVLLRELSDADLVAQRTIVTLPEGNDGRAVVTLEDNPETEFCYSVVRNRLYTMGSKSQGQSYGEDEPIDLSQTEELVLDARHEWNAVNVVFF